ncbi:MAG: polysaccharide deacetylase family protein [Betaproteobacteria bacterium]
MLIFHRVLESRDALFPSEQYRESFAARMKWVRDRFNVLSLSEGIQRLESGSLPERPLCITFDDGYADNYSVALPILADLGLTATFFVASGYLNGGRMWNDTIIEAIRLTSSAALDLGHVGLSEMPVAAVSEKREAISSILAKVKYLPGEDRLKAAERIARSAGVALPDRLMMTDAEVRALHGHGMEIGAHTVSHPILLNQCAEDAQTEIVDGKNALEKIIDAAVRLFAYPNGIPGQDYLADHVRMVRAAGYRGAVSTAWGAARSGDDIFQVPRFTPWDTAMWRFGLRLAQNIRREDYRIV